MNRRSFVSMVMGTAGAAVAATLETGIIPAGSTITFDMEDVSPIWREFAICDEILIQPGTIPCERLFCPPAPQRFEVTRLAIGLQESSPLKDWLQLLQGLSVEVSEGSRLMAQSPLWYFANSGRGDCSVTPVWCFNAGHEFAFWIKAREEMRLQAPVTLSTMLAGRLDYSERLRQEVIS